MKLIILMFSFSIALFGCSSAKPVKPMMNFSQYQGTCKLTNDDSYKKPRYEYPLGAFKVGQEGWVVLKFDLLNGTPKNIQVIGSSPKGVFESSAIEALSNSLYKPNTNKEGCILSSDFTLN